MNVRIRSAKFGGNLNLASLVLNVRTLVRYVEFPEKLKPLLGLRANLARLIAIMQLHPVVDDASKLIVFLALDSEPRKDRGWGVEGSGFSCPAIFSTSNSRFSGQTN